MDTPHANLTMHDLTLPERNQLERFVTGPITTTHIADKIRARVEVVGPPLSARAQVKALRAKIETVRKKVEHHEGKAITAAAALARVRVENPDSCMVDGYSTQLATAQRGVQQYQDELTDLQDQIVALQQKPKQAAE